MIQELTVDVNALGIARRSEKQVEQKIRDEIKILKKYGNAVISERNKTGGGRMGHLPRLTMAQKRAFDALERRPRIMGLREGPEIGQIAAKRGRTELEAQGPSTAHSSAASSQLPSSASSVVSGSTSQKSMKDDILAKELENQRLKQELLIKKNKLADLQIEYWTKRIRHL